MKSTYPGKADIGEKSIVSLRTFFLTNSRTQLKVNIDDALKHGSSYTMIRRVRWYLVREQHNISNTSMRRERTQYPDLKEFMERA